MATQVFADEELERLRGVYRRKISRQLNKGESLHAVKRDLLYPHESTVRARQLQARPNKHGA